MDGKLIGTTEFSGPLGSESGSARNYIGRASELTDSLLPGDEGTYVWFGYISGVRVCDEALPPEAPVPALSPVVSIVLACLLAASAWMRTRLLRG